MAVIDTFLKLLIAQKAETLVLVPDQIPSVIKANEATELPMPAVPADLARRLAVEVVGADPSGAAPDNPVVEGTYCTADGEEFAYQADMSAASFRLEIHSLAEPDEDDEEDPAPAHAPMPTLPEPPASPVPAVAETGNQDPRPAPEILGALEQAHAMEASDIFLSSGKPAQVRLHGELKELAGAHQSAARIESLIPDPQLADELASSGNVDFGISLDVAGQQRRFRFNIFRHSRGTAAAVRPIRDHIPPLSQLHLPPDLVELTNFQSGLVIVTGASGAGKSTTLASLVEHVNQTRSHHVITIEDPIEFEHQQGKSLIHQREVGASVQSFSSGLRAALRENPDVILLGEMRDLPTISAALTAAETGHLVLSTLHTGSATSAISRIVDVFPGHQQAHVRVQLAASLRAVVSQRLIPSTRDLTRVPAIEKLVVTPAVANSIREGHEHHMRSAMQTGGDQGMITLERSLASLTCRGLISSTNAHRYAHDVEALAKLLE